MAALDERRPLCRHFRSKVMYTVGAEADPTAHRPGSGSHCWCLRTTRDYGPDDERVDYDDCRPGRPCHELL